MSAHQRDLVPRYRKFYFKGRSPFSADYNDIDIKHFRKISTFYFFVPQEGRWGGGRYSMGIVSPRNTSFLLTSSLRFYLWIIIKQPDLFYIHTQNFHTETQFLHMNSQFLYIFKGLNLFSTLHSSPSQKISLEDILPLSILHLVKTWCKLCERMSDCALKLIW